MQLKRRGSSLPKVGGPGGVFCCWGWGLERENVQSSSDSSVIKVSSSSLMYSLTSYSKNFRGTAPHCSTTSWKSLISNLSPANKTLIKCKNNEEAEFFVSINPSIFLHHFNISTMRCIHYLEDFLTKRVILQIFFRKLNFSLFHWVFIPSALLAFFLSCFIFNSPTLYAQACPGKVT